MDSKIKQRLAVILLLIISSMSFAQFTPIPASGNNSYKFQNTNSVDRIGFGNANIFPNGTSLPSVVTINSIGLTFPTGEVFRTDAPAGQNTYWRMLHGGIEYGAFYNNSGSMDFNLQATDPNGNMIFNTGGANERLRITAFGSIQGGPGCVASGFNSFAYGQGNTAVGNESFAFGNNNTANAKNSFAFGAQNIANGDGSFAFGPGVALADGDGSFAFGTTIQARGDYSYVMGESSQTATGAVHAFCFGRNSQANATESFAIGTDCHTSQNNAYAIGRFSDADGERSFAIGDNLVSQGFSSFAIGRRSESLGDDAITLGTRLRSRGIGSITIGYSDTTTGWILENIIDQSMMIGFNSDISTVFVGESGGAGMTGNVGIGDLSAMGGLPNNKLEITSDGNSPTPGGLRFTNLTSASSTIGTATKYLSVDANGDVVLVDDGGGGTGITQANNGVSIDPGNSNQVQLGRQVGTIGLGFLIHDTEIPTNGHNIYWPEPAAPTAGQNQFIIGNLPSGVPAKVQMASSAESITLIAGNSSVVSSQESVGVHGESTGGSYWAIGVRGRSLMPVADKNTGVRARAENGINISTALDIDVQVSSSPLNYGFHSLVKGTANGYNYGGYSTVSMINTGTNYGIFTFANYASSNYGIYAAANGGSANYAGYFYSPGGGGSFAGYFLGDVMFSGNVLGSQMGWTSDQKFKTNVNDLNNPITIISQLDPKTYNYDTINYRQFGFNHELQYGLIAQDVEAILPELVSNEIQPAQFDTLGNQTSPRVDYKALNYNAFIAILIAGMQEQQAQIDSLQSQINTMNASNRSGGGGTTQPAQRSSNWIQQSSLDQNVPNPFNDRTTIGYELKADGNVRLEIFDMYGNSVSLLTNSFKEKGSYSEVWIPNRLPTGTYTYVLSVNDEVLAKKALYYSK